MLIFGFRASAQIVRYDHLSREFNFEIKTIKSTDITYPSWHEKVFLYIYNKKHQLKQIIKFTSGDIYDAFESNTSGRSYSTGLNKNNIAPDDDFGDIIVADINFDGKEDIAIKYDYTVDAGPVYLFYLQGVGGKFSLSHYLSNKVDFFPLDIDFDHKTIMTQVHANAYQQAQKTFRYNKSTHKWKLIKWVMVK